MLTLYNKPTNTIKKFDDLFNDFWGMDKFFDVDNEYFNPLNDIIETDNGYEIEVMLPGFSKKDINLEVVDNKLIIEGERKVKDDAKYNVRQSYYGKFKKSYTLPNDVKKDNIDAKFKDGILKLDIPKDKERVSSRLIEIK